MDGCKSTDQLTDIHDHLELMSIEIGVRST